MNSIWHNFLKFWCHYLILLNGALYSLVSTIYRTNWSMWDIIVANCILYLEMMKSYMSLPLVWNRNLFILLFISLLLLLWNICNFNVLISFWISWMLAWIWCCIQSIILFNYFHLQSIFIKSTFKLTTYLWIFAICLLLILFVV